MHLAKLSLGVVVVACLVPNPSEATGFKVLHTLKAHVTRPGVVKRLDGRRFDRYSLVKINRNELEIVDNKNSKIVGSVALETSLFGKRAKAIQIATHEFKPQLTDAIKEGVLKDPMFAGLKTMHLVPPKAVQQAVATIQPGEGKLGHLTSIHRGTKLAYLEKALDTNEAVAAWLDTVASMVDYGKVYYRGFVVAGHATFPNPASFEQHVEPGYVYLDSVVIKR